MFTIKLANKIILVIPRYESTEIFLSEYITDLNEKSDFCVEVTSEDLSNERKKYVREATLEGEKIIDYSDNYLETLALYRKITTKLSDYGIILFHGSVIAVDGIAYLFTAKSGTGKSTHTRLWREHFLDRAVMINDDKPLIEVRKDGVTAYGTPWDGKHHLSTNTSAPLKAICILERGEKNEIEKIEIDEAYPLFLQQIYNPTDRQALTSTLDTLDRLMDKVSIYRLKCNMNEDAVEIAYKGMQEEQNNEIE